MDINEWICQYEIALKNVEPLRLILQSHLSGGKLDIVFYQVSKFNFSVFDLTKPYTCITCRSTKWHVHCHGVGASQHQTRSEACAYEHTIFVVNTIFWDKTELFVLFNISMSWYIILYITERLVYWTLGRLCSTSRVSENILFLFVSVKMTIRGKASVVQLTCYKI